MSNLSQTAVFCPKCENPIPPLELPNCEGLVVWLCSDCGSDWGMRGDEGHNGELIPIRILAMEGWLWKPLASFPLGEIEI
jgi:hypothetical protein